jgi:hypothetical protein
MIGGLIGLAFNTPAGALIDSTRAKPTLVVGLAILAVSAIAICFVPQLLARFRGEHSHGGRRRCLRPGDRGVDAGPFPKEGARAPPGPQLRLRPRRQCRRRGGRRYHRLGDLAAAVFLLVPIFALLASLAVLSIPANAIDHDRARGAGGKDASAVEVSSWSVLLQCRPLVIFGICVALFHFANAPPLPLVGHSRSPTRTTR